MLKKMNRYSGHAYSVANTELKVVGEVEEGSWVTLDTDGKLIVSDGTKKSFLLTGSQRIGRNYTDNLLFKGVSFLFGPFYGMNTSNFDTRYEYPPMTPCKVTTGGILTPTTGVGPEIIEAYAIKKISATELEIMSASGREAIASHLAPVAPSVSRDDTANSVTGLTTAMEYKLDAAPAYVTYVANTFNAIDFAGNHTLLVRNKKAGSYPASEVTTLVFGTNATPVAPTVTRDDTANTVTGMTTAMEYNLDNAGYVTYDETTFNAIDLAGVHTLLVRTKVLGTNPTGSVTTLAFTTNAAPAAPTVTRDDTANTVTGLTTAMEYKLDTAGYVTYDAATFNAIDLAGAHTLLVRTKVLGTNPVGAATTLVFTTNEAPVAPTVTRDDGANTVTGMTTAMEYKLDAAGYVTYVAETFNGLDFTGEHTLLVRTKVLGTNPVGADTTLVFTTNQ